MNTQIAPQILAKAQEWLNMPYDAETSKKVQQLIDNDPKELEESFYRSLEFGTGGLRGIMGVGTNRMNKYTVAKATQGFANYMKKMFPGKSLAMAIAHDCRNNSPYFARITAEVMSANDIKVYLFEDLRPTPELSFAIRELNCQSGVMITASHNPKEYNGYKAYWEDGGQLIAPHDKNVIAEVEQINSLADVKFDAKNELIEYLGASFDNLYIERIKGLSLSPEMIKRQKDFRIVYTPIHGTGVKLTPQALKAFGFEAVYNVPAQDEVDGNFPTVISPNPEEPAALKIAIERALEVDAQLVMATDPDGDRVGIAVRNDQNNFVLLNGNQAASLLIYYLLTKWQENGKLKGKEYIVKTIVTSELLFDIADKFGVEKFDVLTGFKYIADIIRKYDGKKTFIGGGEESYGYLVGDFVRDKDAVSSCAMLAETAAWAADQGKSMFTLLKELYVEFGFYKEKLLSVTKKGKEGAEAIKAMMEKFRNNAPKLIGGIKLIQIKDYQNSTTQNLLTGETLAIDLPKSDVLQFVLEDGSKISVRPSGTEPKIKFYFGVKASLAAVNLYDETDRLLDDKIEAIKSSLEIS
ncbi:MAG: phospho-sugar mutase [Bacteroidetes bacterium]|nr:phospho-sugar mutase [Bacteroidota bacterium]MBU1578605.1 phospho-sugar mutase [Bacteroidota bacterium]MBU2464868.1 phospho-sugar mutase [Bacteroidota bacterium]MBU2556836.1 phospho-sugar mutase [Bacteroidota bacterium]